MHTSLGDFVRPASPRRLPRLCGHTATIRALRWPAGAAFGKVAIIEIVYVAIPRWCHRSILICLPCHSIATGSSHARRCSRASSKCFLLHRTTGQYRFGNRFPVSTSRSPTDATIPRPLCRLVFRTQPTAGRPATLTALRACETCPLPLAPPTADPRAPNQRVAAPIGESHPPPSYTQPSPTALHEQLEPKAARDAPRSIRPGTYATPLAPAV